jgi:hypothetical protein
MVKEQKSSKWNYIDSSRKKDPILIMRCSEGAGAVVLTLHMPSRPQLQHSIVHVSPHQSLALVDSCQDPGVCVQLGYKPDLSFTFVATIFLSSCASSRSESDSASADTVLPSTTISNFFTCLNGVITSRSGEMPISDACGGFEVRLGYGEVNFMFRKRSALAGWNCLTNKSSHLRSPSWNLTSKYLGEECDKSSNLKQVSMDKDRTCCGLIMASNRLLRYGFSYVDIGQMFQ